MATLPYRLNCGREIDLANLTPEDLDVLRSDQVTEAEATEIRDLMEGIVSSVSDLIEMVNPTPHAKGCKADKTPLRLGNAYFCPTCHNRLGFVPDGAHEQQIVDGLEQDLGEEGPRQFRGLDD